MGLSAAIRSSVCDSEQDGRSLANQMVTDFMDYYRFEDPDDFVTMSAVDLLFLPNVAHKVEVLAAHLQAEASFAASAVGDARSGAEAYARVYADKFEEYAAIDLHHFASILAPSQWLKYQWFHLRSISP